MIDDTTPFSLPRRTTPTWEVELLISGVAVFAMLQLPGLLDDALFAVRPRFEAAMGEVLFLLYMYTKGATLILAATFALHLLLRAQWIALVGLHSIHPQGVDWDKLDMGPIMRSLEMLRLGSTETAIERADNRATTVFAMGVTFASLLVTVALVFGLVLLAANLLGFAIEPGWMGLVLGLLMLPFLAAQVADRRLARWLAKGSLGHRLVSMTLQGYSRAGMGLANHPAMALLSGQQGRRRVVLTMMAVFMAAMLAVAFWLQGLRDPSSLGSYGWFPEAVGGLPTVEAAHYEDQRNPQRDGPVPYIQSAVVVQPYLRLVVPADPRHDNETIRRECAGSSLLADAARAAAVLDCLQRLRAPTLDGKPVPGLRYDIGSDPRTNRPALVAMIDIRGLPRGRHELRLPPMSSAGQDAEPHVIPFWR
jgi:hypothetical protein